MDEEQLTNIIAQAAALSDDEVVPFLTDQGLSEEDIDEAMEVLEALKGMDAEAKDNITNTEPGDAAERIASDNMDDAEQAAAKMADEDDSEVTVTEEDKDSDGDMDKVTIKKEEPEDDMSLTDEERSALDAYMNGESGDTPHDAENSTNSIAQHLSQYRY